MQSKPKVYLIGAGPGDPGLLTLKGKEILERSDVIVYDYLVNPALLKYAKEGAEILYVGKKAGQKEMSQDYINKLLIKKAKAGATVARLKGGDPFVFGRGGEEVQALSSAGIPVEVVPGVTSASAVPAYAGIPLTHRDYTSSFAVVTGHETPSKDESGIPWEALTKIGTLVFLMGVKNLGDNMKRLIGAGKPADTPAAIITRGTYPSQVSVTGTIENIAKKVKRRKDIGAPAILIVGGVVNLKGTADWFESKPLFGKCVLVTRPKEQAAPFVKLLEAEGARIIEFPTIEIKPPRSFKRLDRAIKNLRDYDWIVFTSVNGVDRFLGRLRERGRDIRDLYGIKVAAIGSKTAQSLERAGIAVETVPRDFRAEGLIEIFSGIDIKDKKILIPRAKEARSILPDTLLDMGARVDVAEAYETKKPSSRDTKIIKKLLENKMIDVLTFTSSSTARNFFSKIGNIPKKTVIACIGPVTAGTVKEAGYKPTITPDEYTVDGLADAIVRYYSGTCD